MVDLGHLAREPEIPMPPRPSKTEHVTATLADRIRSGVYPPGSLLPSDANLRKEFSVSQQVIRLAVDRLKERGLIEFQPGVGRYVKET